MIPRASVLLALLLAGCRPDPVPVPAHDPWQLEDMELYPSEPPPVSPVLRSCGVLRRDSIRATFLVSPHAGALEELES